MAPHSKATLVDVALAAGVSRSTASNVFAHPERVRPELRARVEAAAEARGYGGPDPRGKLLRDGKVNAFGLLPPGGFGIADALRNPVFRQLLTGISEVFDEAGASLVIMPDRPGNSGVRTALVDGLILWRVEHLAEIKAARLRRLPFVVIDADPGPEVNSVRSDARAGAAAAARHLVGLGHRRFAILSFLRDFDPPRWHAPGRPRSPEAAGMQIDQDKLAGYAEALAGAGIAVGDVPMVQAHPWDRDAARLLLEMAPEATAILSMSAMQGIAIIDEARRRGREVPRDLSVAAYNDIPEAARSAPPLTTVDSMLVEKGRVAARMLLDPGPVRHELLPSRLIIRESTAPPPRRRGPKSGGRNDP